MKTYKNIKEFKNDFNNISPIDVYNEVVSGRYIRTFPKNYWIHANSLENGKKILKYLIEETLKWSEEDIKNNVNVSMFIDNKLNGMLKNLFTNSPFKAIDAIYPDKFKPWEFKSVPRNYWNKETAKEATKWLIEKKLKWSEEDIKEKLCVDTFTKNGLQGMSTRLFKSSPFETINNAYPNKFKPWEFGAVLKSYWNLLTAKEATIWLIEEKLKWSEEDIKEKLCTRVFIDNGLYGMINTMFHCSPFETINNAYPNKFKPWEFKTVQYKYWNLCTTKDATRWMIEEKLKWSDDDIKKNLTIKTFINNGLYGMLSSAFRGSPYEAIDNAYPGRFNKFDIKSYHNLCCKKWGA